MAQAKAQVNIGVGSQVKGVVQVGGRGRSKNPYFLGPFLFLCSDEVFWVK